MPAASATRWWGLNITAPAPSERRLMTASEPEETEQR